jgi:hypothetical protein
MAAAVMTEAMLDQQPVVDVFARFGRNVWVYSYIEPCTRCGRIHRHGGGNGAQPDLSIGQVGGWGSHCPMDAVQIGLRLVQVIPKPVPITLHGTALERGLAGARTWREAHFYACPICPPHASGELTHHKSQSFHQSGQRQCDICAPLRPGVPRSHNISRRHPRRAIRHITTEVAS